MVQSNLDHKMAKLPTIPLVLIYRIIDFTQPKSSVLQCVRTKNPNNIRRNSRRKINEFFLPLPFPFLPCLKILFQTFTLNITIFFLLLKVVICPAIQTAFSHSSKPNHSRRLMVYMKYIAIQELLFFL